MQGYIEYAESCFKYKLPNIIIGENIYKSLKKLEIKFQENTSSVESDLGGRDHSLLDLVLIDSEYVEALITLHFQPPNYPNLLNILENSSQA